MIPINSRLTLLILLFSMVISCNYQNNEKDKNPGKENNIPPSNRTTQQKLSSLMDSLVNINNANTEKRILDKIWQYTYIERAEVDNNIEIFSLYLSAIDSVGNQVANKLESAQGKVTAYLTVNQPTKEWSKTIEFTVIKKENLYLLMRE